MSGLGNVLVCASLLCVYVMASAGDMCGNVLVGFLFAMMGSVRPGVVAGEGRLWRAC